MVAKGLVRLGLIQAADATVDPPAGMDCPATGCLQLDLYALHGFGGHGIGLEVHDPAQYYQEIDDRWGLGDVSAARAGLSSARRAACAGAAQNRAARRHTDQLTLRRMTAAR